MNGRLRPRKTADSAEEQLAPRPSEEAARRPEPSRLSVLSVKVDAALRSEIDAYAHEHGITRSRAAQHYLSIAQEARREREGIPASRADELLQELSGVRAGLDIVGPAALGMLRLLAHWGVQTGALKVSEDELLAEIRTVGADEWEQAISEAERELHQLASETWQEGSE